MEKITNVGSRLHNPAVGGALTGANEIKDDTKGKMQNVINQETDAELLRLDGAKQDKLTFDQTPTEGSTNPVTSRGVYAADAALQQAIEAILLLIPSAASALNQLADKSFVNSSIATDTATFRGTYNLVTDLELTVSATHQQIAMALASVVSTADNNDYCFVQIPVSDQSSDIRVTERYKFDGTSWEYEYDLNNSGFTADQWSAINSGITSILVGKLGGLPTAAELATMFAGKQNTLMFDNTPVAGSDNPVKSSGLYNAFAAINAIIPEGADANNKLVAESRLVAYVTTLINALDATFNVTSADGHVTLCITQADGLITSVQILTSDIASASAFTTLGGRVSMTEADIDALQDAYAALTQSDVVIVEGALPSTGQQNIIYRQLDQDHTPPQFYSDYMWNGTTWVLMATYMNAIDPRPKKGSQNLVTSGGVFDNMGALDVSELNATENPHTLAIYADLSAALAAIPSDYQKGGMSIKFVQSSDNTYVQFRLMKNQWSTTPSDWQADDINNRLILLAGITQSQQSLSVGDYYYQYEYKQLRKVTGNSTYDVLPFVDGALYSYLGKIFTWNGTDLVLSEDFVNVNAINERTDSYPHEGSARANVKIGLRKQGLIITYLLDDGWMVDQFVGDDIEDWNNSSKWISLLPVDMEPFNTAMKRIQTSFDCSKVELGGLNSSGAETSLTNRARTVLLKAPFEITLATNSCFLFALKYTVQPNGNVVYDSTDSSVDGKTTCKKDDGIWRFVMYKTDNTDITASELASIVASYKGTIDFLAEDIHDVEAQNLNDSSLWESGYYNGSGNKASSDQRARTKDRIDESVNYIKVATGTQYYLIAWDSSGTFKKYWDGGEFQDNGMLLSDDIDIAMIRIQNPGYTFAIFGVSDDVADYSSNFVFLNGLYRSDVKIDNLKDDEYNNESLWTRAYINSSGALVSSTNRIATRNFIDESVDVAYLTHVYPYFPVAFVIAYKEDGTYAGIVQSDDLSIASTASDFEITVPLREIRKKHPDCLFRMVLYQNNQVDIDVDYSSNCQFKNLLQARMDRIEYNKPIITFIDDDGSSEQYDNWKLIYDACGICCSFAVVTVGITSEDEVKIKQYGNLGFEFVSHSHGHSDLTTRTEEQLVADFKATIATLRGLGIKAANPEILVYPYNHVNDLVESVAQDYFKCGIEGGEHRVNGKPLDRFHIRRESMLSSTRTKEVEIGGETVNVAIPKNLDEWKPYIDDLVAKNGWLVIMSHFRNSYEQDHYYFDETYIPPVVALAKYALSRGCEILTAGAAFEKFKNKLEIGKVTDEHHYIVDCNGKVYDTME